MTNKLINTLFLIFFLMLLAGCSEKQNITSGITLELKPDYSNFEVIKLEGEGECTGTEAQPCKATAIFRVKEKITLNPMQLFEVDTEIKSIKGYNKKITFEPEHDYTLKYEVLKINPTDTITWKFAGVE